MGGVNDTFALKVQTISQDCPYSLADTVQRLGSRLGSTFVDGGVHPRFGTRNFTLPLQNGQYIEVVCPLDHPATEQTPWGKAVSKKAQEGGGWLTWVFATEDISKVEDKFGCTATVVTAHAQMEAI